MNLNKAYFIKLEIDSIREQIESLSNIDLNKKQKLLDKLNKSLVKYCDQLVLINDYIDSIEDNEIRLIARYRFINNLTWVEIGDKMMLDRTACYRKLNKYLNKNNTNNTKKMI